MARNVTYSVSPRINPRDKDAAPKYYGHVQASGDIDLREMSERIQATCTVHKSDVFAVLVALEDVITDASLIKKAPITCRAGSALTGTLTNLTFAKVKPRYTKADKEAGDEVVEED